MHLFCITSRHHKQDLSIPIILEDMHTTLDQSLYDLNGRAVDTPTDGHLLSGTVVRV